MTINLKNLKDLIIPQYSIIVLTMFSVFLIVEKGMYNLPLLLLPIIVYLFSLFGFNILNMVFDLEMDKISKPLRPIPSKRVTVKEAKILAGFFYFISFAFSLLNLKIFLVMVFFILSITLYSHPKFFLRKFFWATPLFGTIFYSIIPFLSVVFIFEKETPLFFLLLFSGLVATVSISKDIEDVKSEKKFGIKSIPIIIGIRNSLRLIPWVLLLLLILVIISIFLNFINQLFLYAAFLSLVLTLIFSRIFFKFREEQIVTQSKIVTNLTILVVLIQLLFGITAFFI